MRRVGVALLADDIRTRSGPPPQPSPFQGEGAHRACGYRVIEKILQLSLNGLMAGAVLAVPAIGLTMIYAVLRFVNFSVAAHMAVGAFAGYMLNVWLGLPAWIAIFGAFIGAAAFGIASDHVGLRPLRGQSALTLAIASIAVNLMIESTIRFFFGGQPARLRDPAAARLAFRLPACRAAAGGERHHRGRSRWRCCSCS